MKRNRLIAIVALAACAILIAHASLHLHSHKDLACRLCEVSRTLLAGIVVVLPSPDLLDFGICTDHPVSHADSRPPLHAPQRAPPLA